MSKRILLVIVCLVLCVFVASHPSTAILVSYTPLPTLSPKPITTQSGEIVDATAAPLDSKQVSALMEAAMQLSVNARSLQRYILLQSSAAQLSRADVQHLLPYELDLAWKEIYARQGKILDDYFVGRPGFAERTGFRERDLTRTQQDNISMLKTLYEESLDEYTLVSKDIEDDDVDVSIDGQTVRFSLAGGKLLYSIGEINDELQGQSDGRIYRCDLDTNDELTELAIPLTLDEQLYTVFYRVQPDSLVELGRTEGNIDHARVLGDGTVLSEHNKKLLTSWKYRTKYALSGAVLAEIEPVLQLMNIPVQLKQTITLQSQPGGTKPVTFTVGENATLLACDGARLFVVLPETNDLFGWFTLADDGRTILPPDQAIDEVFKILPH